MTAEKTIKVDEVVFRTDLYPRIETSPETVQRYAADLDVLPPAEVNQRNELIDGWHRWTAHKTAKRETIRVIVTPTASDAELLELAITRNATHGLQLSRKDKEAMACKIYAATPEKERVQKKADLMQLLSVSKSTIAEWMKDIDRSAREARDKKIRQMWLACYTEKEIGDAVGFTQQAANLTLQEFPDLEKLVKSERLAAEFNDADWEPPLYNVWTANAHSHAIEHFGKSEPRWVERLIYMYTEPFDIVVDPFAGSGSTIDVCRKRLRRYYVSDRAPIPAREADIRKHDITEGMPSVPRWKDVRLVYLDPPYWKQAAGEYSDDANDLANMDLEKFTKTLAKTIADFAEKLKGTSARIALILQPTQWRADGRAYTDHVADMIRAVKLPIDLRIQAPYSSQQCTPQMVEWAKSERKVLVLSREIVVWSVKQ